MRTLTKCFGVLTIGLAFSANSFADKFGRAEFVGSGYVTLTKGTFAAVTTKYFRGDYGGLRVALRDLLRNPVFVDENGQVMPPPHKFDFDSNFYSFVFLTTNPTTKKDELVRVLTYADSFVRKYSDAGAVGIEFGSSMLPGEHQLYDIHLSDSAATRFGSVYTFKETQSPLLAELLKAAKQVVFGEIAGHVAQDPGALRPSDETHEKVYFDITRVLIPGRRGDLTVKSVVNPGADASQTETPISDHEVKSILNETTYSNVPLQRVSVGLVAAGMFTHDGDQRVKVTDQKVASDPLSGAMSIAAFYIHPVPFINGISEPSRAERIRFLIGYVASPEPGVALGGAVLLFRGLTFNAGYSWMIVDKARAGLNVGDSVTTTKPLKTGVSRSVFAGLGYNFD